MNNNNTLNNQQINMLLERRAHIAEKTADRRSELACNQASLAGAVSQRACVYSGARVVLNPITDAAHIVHGPIGCAAYTWDIRGSLSSGSRLYRQSFSTDLQTREVIFGGEQKLYHAIREVARDYRPAAIFVY
ncbi:MAG TPA: nitrogenase iron-molybdenum cofactor biosynthesis protein NifE, partial [Actinobacteria bacterium]|nr:nitrogenase iron-molybdenum cofactor biosynthesis protein NifE [Actinomycetes bacterium]HEX21072.1 nitrogenase iron-molybdenum cofactor biosynthesis protein NifE [Actinomycetota bacterium]